MREDKRIGPWLDQIHRENQRARMWRTLSKVGVAAVVGVIVTIVMMNLN